MGHEQLRAAVGDGWHGDKGRSNQRNMHVTKVPQVRYRFEARKRHSNPSSAEARSSGMRTRVFVAGATGYVGTRVIPALLDRGHSVVALVRKGSESKAPRGCRLVVGDPFDRRSFVEAVSAGDTFLQLVGVPWPSPAKARQF